MVSGSVAQKRPHDVSGPSASTDNSVPKKVMELLTGGIINMNTTFQQISKNQDESQSKFINAISQLKSDLPSDCDGQSKRQRLNDPESVDGRSHDVIDKIENFLGGLCLPG